MSLKVEPGLLASTVVVPRSKSYANRYLILGARSGKLKINHLPQAEDVTHLVKCLEAVGLQLSRGPESVEFLNSFPACEPSGGAPLDLLVGEGGTTARFLLALLSRGQRTYRLHLAGRLSERPWSELIDALTLARARVVMKDSMIEVTGPVELTLLPKTISAARSTQFGTALQLAFHADGMEFELQDLSSSLPYWQMTRACLHETSEVTVPADWSSAAYPLCLAAVKQQSVNFPHLSVDDVQADSVLASLLMERGVLQIEGKGLRTTGQLKRDPISLNMKDCLDLAPAMAFLCAHLEGESELGGLEGLVHKESDRMTAIQSLLKQVGVTFRADGHKLIIQGSRLVGPWKLSTPADHRLVMTAALFLRAHQGGTLEHPECVEKSFPSFFKVLGF